MSGPRRGPTGPIVLGAILTGVGLLGVTSLLPVSRSAQHSASMQTVQASPPSAAALRSMAIRGAHVLFPASHVLGIYIYRPGRGYTAQVLAVIGQHGGARLFMDQAVTPQVQGLFGGTNQQGWSIPDTPAGATGVPNVSPAQLPPELRLRLDAWLRSCGAHGLLAIWPFPRGTLAVARAHGQEIAAQFLPASGQPNLVLGYPPVCGKP